MTNIQFQPEALLLDFGGVLYSSTRRDAWREDMADLIFSVIRRAGLEPPARETIIRDLEVARIAESSWKTAASRTPAPDEISGRQYFGEFVAGDWDRASRAALLASANTLSQSMVDLTADHVVRDGVKELLEEARRRNIPVAIVSNTRSGAAFRALLARDGLDDLITVEVFSDEAGVRKPNPQMLHLAASALGTDPANCWYAGDHYDRDVMCARRAGIGVAVLVRDQKTVFPPYPAQVAPDIEVESPRELAEALAAATEQSPPTSSKSLPVGGPAHRSHLDRPAALLLDHGGVIVSSTPNESGRLAFADRLLEYLHSTGWFEFDLDRLIEDIEHAHDLHGVMKAPEDSSIVDEVSNLSFWRDLVAGQWPEHPRAAVAANARPLMIDHIETRSVRTIRPGMLDLLQLCHDEHIAVGIVSNTLCGQAVRNLSFKIGTAPYLSTEIYSDELGRRKPDPTTILAAADALGVEPGDCWYVGDKPGRDLICGRRAGIGTTVLMRRPQDPAEGQDADLVFENPIELLRHLEQIVS